MKRLVYILFIFCSLSLAAQNESLFNGSNFAAFFIDAAGPFSGVDDIISDGVGNGTFTGGTFTYTVDENYNFIFNEDFGTETHTYIGATDPSGEYSILIPDTAEDVSGMVTTMKLSDNKTNASFTGDFITSYYRYDAPDDMFIGLFSVSSNGVDTCTYHQLMGTAPTDDEDFTYTVDNEGRITLRNDGGTHVISAAIDNAEGCYSYASIVNGFFAYGNGVKNTGESQLSEIKGKYKLVQHRYANSYGEQSSSLLTINLNEDGTGSYTIDANMHDENSVGTLEATYQADGIWEIVLDNDTDYTIYCAINPTERLITGYFNFEGNSPGIIFGISKELPTPSYNATGSVTGADNVTVSIEGDTSEEILVTLDGGTYALDLEQGQSVTVTPIKEGYSFAPTNISVTNIQSDTTLETISATINSYTLSGRIVGADNVLVSMSGDATADQTFIEGTPYSFSIDHGQSVSITPNKEGYEFTPPSITVNYIQTDSILEAFTATPEAFTLSGSVAGADVVLISLSGDATDSETIDAGSTYNFSVNHGQNVTITPAKDGYTFTPVSITINNVQADSILNAFTASPKVYTVSGSVSGTDGVLISISGDVTNSQTIDNGGIYSFEIEYAQNVTIIPSKEGYTFTPASIILESVTTDQTGQDFSAQVVNAIQEVTPDKIKIYPNPANQLINVDVDYVHSIEILDITGKVLESYDCSSQSTIQIDISKRNTGLYILRLISDKGIDHRRIVKE